MFMEWNDLNESWQRCFELAWESMREGSKPIAALIVNEKGEIVSEGKNAIYNDYPEATMSFNEMAHAEVNALGNIDNRVHTFRAPYTLYSTLEPCPLCTGALYMSGIKHLVYAANDKLGGSLDMLGKTEYLSRKKIYIEGPVPVLGNLSVFLNVYFDITQEHMKPSIRALHNYLAEDYPDAVALARKWGEKKQLDIYIEYPFQTCFSLIVEGLQSIKKTV